TALVSTNSITQGEQASLLWKILIQDFSVSINFAYKTFKWNSEVKDKAAVHCVIIGFGKDIANKKIFETTEKVKKVSHINGYLAEASDIFIENRTKPICSVPQMIFGSMPNDGGALSNFSTEEKKRFANLILKQNSSSKNLLGQVNLSIIKTDGRYGYMM
ncbi:MAG: DNA methyltransferase, partial [Streptococcus alactolyticus]